MSRTRSTLDDSLPDVRGGGEARWLDLLDDLVAMLSEATASYIHIGSYWIFDEPRCASASLCARVQSRSALPDVESDYWEATICYSINEGGGPYSDVFAFPFLKESPRLRRGRLRDLDPGSEVDEFRWFQFENGEYVDRGWGLPDGPGEWGWITQPADVYIQRVDVEASEEGYRSGGPINIRISLDKHLSRLQMDTTSRVSLLFVNRNREGTNLAPWNARPPRRNSQHTRSLGELCVQKNAIEVDLSKFNIRGGWLPGRYHLGVRTQNFHTTDWTGSSDISEPFKIVVKE